MKCRVLKDDVIFIRTGEGDERRFKPVRKGTVMDFSLPAFQTFSGRGYIEPADAEPESELPELEVEND